MYRGDQKPTGKPMFENVFNNIDRALRTEKGTTSQWADAP